MSRAINPGTTIDRYRVERPLGSGSMGDVFLSVDIGLDRNVALKILSERHRDNRELRARFVREAKAVAAIAHPNVVQVFTTGTYDGRPYIAMEFLDGTDLGTWIEENQPLSSAQAARAVLDVARGLDAAAKAGLIHRDVKPSNLVLLHDGAVKVTDFGLAKPMEPGDQPALTALGVVVGTPDYIAPEQARGEAIDQRVDIYALGGTLYYLLTGMPPFRTGNPHQDKYLKVVARHLKDPPPDASVRNPLVDRQLARLVRRMMAKAPAERPDYDSLMQQLEAMAERIERESGAVVPLGKGRGRGPGNDRLSPTPVAGAAGEAGPLAQDTVVMPDASADVHGDDAMATQVHMRSAALPRMARSDTREGEKDASESMPVARAPGLPRWLWALTIICALVFVVGLGLRLFGPLPDAPAGKPAESVPPGTSDQNGDQAGAGRASDPSRQPPPGMLLIEAGPDGRAFFIDARPVTQGAYQAMFPSHQGQGASADNAPVTSVSHAYAGSFAEASGKRLPTAEEWRAAAALPGFESPDDTWEWVGANAGSPAAGVDNERPVVSKQGTELRKAAGAKDVTFRLAKQATAP